MKMENFAKDYWSSSLNSNNNKSFEGYFYHPKRVNTENISNINALLIHKSPFRKNLS